MWSHGQGDHEPYSHGEEVEAAAREFLNLRYRLVPYLYSLHELAHRTGIPVWRSVPLQEPADPFADRVDDQYFIGDDLLVAPLFNDGGERKIRLPKGLWYDFFGEAPLETGGREIERTSVPLNRLPVYVRAGFLHAPAFIRVEFQPGQAPHVIVVRNRSPGDDRRHPIDVGIANKQGAFAVMVVNVASVSPVAGVGGGSLETVHDARNAGQHQPDLGVDTAARLVLSLVANRHGGNPQCAVCSVSGTV